MKVENVRDAAGYVIGYIEIEDNGNETLKNAKGKIKGVYEAEADHTRDKHNDIIAKGNILRSMIC